MARPHEVLGVDRDASEREIRRAYRRRVKEAHPDQGGTSAEFRAVQEAYETLLGDGRAPQARGGDGTWRRSRRRDGDRRAGDATGPGRGRYRSARDTRSTPCHVEYLDDAAVREQGWSLDDPDLFETARRAGLDGAKYGRFTVENGDSLLEAAEATGRDWPFSCRGGACANCAVKVCAGALDLPVDHILPRTLTDRGYQLSCVGRPVTGTLQVIFNVKDRPELAELRLPPRG